MPDDFDKILDQAEDLTNRELDAKISSLVRLTDADLRAIFPKQKDKTRLVELMQVVRSAAAENIKEKKIIEGIASYAGTIVKLLSHFV